MSSSMHKNQMRLRLEALEDRSLMSVVFTTVDNGDDSAPTPGSLRAAIIAANATMAPDTITFDIKPSDPGQFYYLVDASAGQVSLDHVTPTTTPGAIDPDWEHTWWSIRPPTPLPEIKWPVMIDGYSQAGATRNSLVVGSDAVLRIELDGEFAGAADGLRFNHGASNSIVSGLVINRFGASGLVGGNGILLDRNGTGMVIEGNIIGLDASGSLAVGNTVSGIRTTNAGARIGGAEPKARNVISGNTLGIFLNNGGGVFNTVIQGNYIGLDSSGALDRGNISSGVSIVGAPGVLVGGSTQGAGNVISGNNTGVWITGTSRHVFPGGFNCMVQGNFIGTNASGTAPLGNTNGVKVLNCSFNLIGGLTARPGSGAGNLISGNDENGISVEFDRHGPRALGTVVQGNIIGLDASGAERLGNGLAGFRTTDAGALVGSVDSRARNIVSANRNGVLLSNSGSSYHTFIQGNRIGTDITGNLDRGNTEADVSVGSAPWTLVGGGVPSAGNVISGNGTGVFIFNISHRVLPGGYNSIVQCNIIGLNATGTQPLGNDTGVLITNGYNLIGGTSPAARNIIAGNRDNGVRIFQADATYPAIGNRVINNHIGTDMTGTRQFGNGLDGVLIGDGAKLNLVRENRILFNGRDGISLESAHKNTIWSNECHLNHRNGIRLDAASTGNRVVDNSMHENDSMHEYDGYDARDDSVGTSRAHTANVWFWNWGETENVPGLLG